MNNQQKIQIIFKYLGVLFITVGMLFLVYLTYSQSKYVSADATIVSLQDIASCIGNPGHTGVQPTVNFAYANKDHQVQLNEQFCNGFHLQIGDKMQIVFDPSNLSIVYSKSYYIFLIPLAFFFIGLIIFSISTRINIQ